jgi:hypothetical protein
MKTRATTQVGPPLFDRFPLGAVRPTGWILAQLTRDLERGFAGCLDQLTEHAAHDLFRQRIESSSDPFAWWDSETRGNWLWGYGMMAHLADQADHKRRARELLDDLKRTQDADGYIGIYSRDSRYRHGPRENGELWGQSRALLSMLAHYELSGDATFLKSVQRAVALTMSQYAPGRSYFRSVSMPGRDAWTGLTHGLCYTDVLEWLDAVAPDEAYRAFGHRLYADFSSMPRPFPNDDLALPNLLDLDREYAGHAVHTAEHLRPLLWASTTTGNGALAGAVRNALIKLKRYTLPSGALLGDEAVHGAPVPDIGYEYCTLTELQWSLASALQKTGDSAYGDWIENLVFNAGQGARLADGAALAYLSADTRDAAVASRGDFYSPDQPGRRFKYSPTHEDVACCCNPNAVRFMPHYASGLWMKLHGRPGVAAVTYGPCVLKTRIAGVALRVDEETQYPFSNSITFTIKPVRAVRFAVWLRRPRWATAAGVSAPGAVISESDGWIIVEKTWSMNGTLSLSFSGSVETAPYANGEYGVRYGALQYVQPIEHELRVTRNYAVTGFHDYDIMPRHPTPAADAPVLDRTGWQIEVNANAHPLHPWDTAPLRVKQGPTTLVPMGCAVLRRASFPSRH